MKATARVDRSQEVVMSDNIVNFRLLIQSLNAAGEIVDTALQAQAKPETFQGGKNEISTIVTFFKWTQAEENKFIGNFAFEFKNCDKDGRVFSLANVTNVSQVKSVENGNMNLRQNFSGRLNQEVEPKLLDDKILFIVEVDDGRDVANVPVVIEINDFQSQKFKNNSDSALAYLQDLKKSKVKFEFETVYFDLQSQLAFLVQNIKSTEDKAHDIEARSVQVTTNESEIASESTSVTSKSKDGHVTNKDVIMALDRMTSEFRKLTAQDESSSKDVGAIIDVLMEQIPTFNDVKEVAAWQKDQIMKLQEDAHKRAELNKSGNLFNKLFLDYTALTPEQLYQPLEISRAQKQATSEDIYGSIEHHRSVIEESLSQEEPIVEEEQHEVRHELA